MRVIVMATAWIALATPARAADCQVPPHRAFEWRFPPDYTVVQVHVRWRDMQSEALVCLAQTLRHRAPAGRFYLAVFDDVEAARYYLWPNLLPPEFAPPEPQLPADRWPWQFEHVRATYHYDVERLVFPETFSLCPMGVGDTQLFSRSADSVDLTATSSLFCGNRVHGRCLLQMKEFRYPKDLLRTPVTTVVRLTARVTREGTIADARVASPVPRGDRIATALARAALQQFRTWRLDPSGTESAVDVSFRFRNLGPALDGGKEVVMELALPDVAITVRPN